MNKKLAFIFIAIIAFVTNISAQADRWQQRIDYKINATLDVATNIVKGTEDIVYTNNSTDPGRTEAIRHRRSGGRILPGYTICRKNYRENCTTR